jgi:hypothetical protein
VKRTRPLITSATYVTRDLGVHENEKPQIAVQLINVTVPAAELAVTRLITAYLTAKGEANDGIASILRQHRTLGNRCRYWVNACGGALPTDYRSRLVGRRNAATHVGQILPEDDVRDAIAVAAEIVAQAIPLSS